MFSAVIFDMDGLLIDSERTIMQTWTRVALDLGVSIAPDAYRRIIGRNSVESRGMLIDLMGSEPLYLEAQQRVRHVLEAPCDEPLFPLKPGALTLLTELARAGVPCAVASSSAAREIRSRLALVDVLHFFKAVAGGDEVPRGKPDPAVYQLAAQRLDMPAERCLAFEDSENGSLAANRSGATVVIVPDLISPTAEMRDFSHMVLDGLDDALAHVPTWFPSSLKPAA